MLKDSAELTPSDLGDKELTINELESIFERVDRRIEKIYPLSPMQEGMLYHWLLRRDSEIYMAQVYFSINGKLDTDLFEKSFNMLVQRHDILRTTFVWQDIRKPRQVVLEKRPVKMNFVDIVGQSEHEQELFIEEFKKKDRTAQFDLTRDILMRITIFIIGKESYKIIWGYHHILIDGWCMGILMEEFLNIYSLLKNDKQIEFKHSHHYKSYIQWLEKQDNAEALMYWKNYMKDYNNKATLLGFTETTNISSYTGKEVRFVIDTELAKGLEGIAKGNKVTLYMVFQAIWGLLLQKYNNVDDVVFGSVVSGRPPEIEEVEKIVGLFINTVPVRIKCNRTQSFLELLKNICEMTIESEKYSYFPLADIQQNTNLKQKSIDSIMAFENFPTEGEINEKLYEFSIRDIVVKEHTNYNFNIIIIPGDELMIALNYNAAIFSDEFIEKIVKHLNIIMKNIVQNPNRSVETIDLISNRDMNKANKNINAEFDF